MAAYAFSLKIRGRFDVCCGGGCQNFFSSFFYPFLLFSPELLLHCHQSSEAKNPLNIEEKTFFSFSPVLVVCVLLNSAFSDTQVLSTILPHSLKLEKQRYSFLSFCFRQILCQKALCQYLHRKGFLI